MVGVMSIQAAKGVSIVCPQFLVLYYWRGWEFNHGDVFICIHGIQMHTDHWDFREILNGPVVCRWHKVGLAVVLRWLWCSSPLPFWVGAVQVRVWQLAYADRVGGETQLQ